MSNTERNILNDYQLFENIGLHDEIYYVPEAYDQEIAFIKAAANPSVNSRMLDLGCGSGIHVQKLREAGMYVVGLDRSHGMLESAKRRNPGCTFIQADMQNFQINQPFDLITCMNGAINYLDNLQSLKSTITRIYDHLTPGGKAIIDTQWSDQLPELPFVTQRGNATIIRRYQKGAGKNGCDLYTVALFSPENERHFVETQNFYFQDPFLMESLFLEQGFTSANSYESYQIDKPYSRQSKVRNAIVVATK